MRFALSRSKRVLIMAADRSAGPILSLCLAALALAACAGDPIVDTGRPGFDPIAYERDLAECRAFAEQVDPGARAAQRGVLGAAVGGAFGAIGGAFGGNAGTGAALGASVGGLGGAVQGAGSGYDRRGRVVRNCLAGRGYAVLD
jgi:hypothetical protein